VARAQTDTGDPIARVRGLERRQRTVRTACAVLLAALAAMAPFVAAPLTGDPGATVGAVVGALLLGGCATAVWPWTWSATERRHHELMTIWAEARPGPDTAVPWDRYAAWATADGERVTLLVLRWAGSAPGPSPLSAEVIRHLDGDDVAEAAGAMEALHERAEELEARARDEHLSGLAAAEHRAHDEALRRVEASAEAHQHRAEAQMRREVGEQHAAERRAQAAALARALRRR